MFKKVMDWMQGRHTFFAATELTIGTVLAWFHRLDMNYVALCGTIQGMVLGHSIKEDWFATKNPPPPVHQPAQNVNPDIPPNGQNG